MTTPIVCHGLDGSDPLCALAALGLFSVGASAGTVQRMGWTWDGGWRPVFECQGGKQALIDAVVEAFVGNEVAAARNSLEQTLRHAAQSGKRPPRGAEAEVERLADEAVKARHPITAIAAHLDDQTQPKKDKERAASPATALSGLTRAQFQQLARAPDAQPYLSGLACDAPLADRKKPIIARTHLSFANKGSNKMLIKDFLGVARRITVPRVEDALFGPATVRDRITGLGWDPASQRSYALQFGDPQDDVSCVVVHNALALVGLRFFPVVPLARDRATVGVYALSAIEQRGQEPPDIDGDDDVDEGKEAGQTPTRQRRVEHFTWPIWEPLLSIDCVHALIARPEFGENTPAADVCNAFGVAALMRSRRYSYQKRSYLAPARPVF